MIKKISQLGMRITFSDLYSGYKGIFAEQKKEFIRALSDYLSVKYVYLLNSGTSAFYLILEALKRLSSKREVILPAYTAPAMVLPVLKAGLKPILCDISLNDFNMDLDLLPQIINPDTLCVVPAHMFGVPVSSTDKIKERFSNIFVVEDCAQSFGTKIQEKNTGIFGDMGFLSFNRGKNLPTYNGGCVFTNSQRLSETINIETDKLEEQSGFLNFMLPFKMTALSLAIRPAIYGMFYPLISGFKDNRVPNDFLVNKYTSFQSGVGISLLKRIDEFSQDRYRNGMTLINGLRDIKEVMLPNISKEKKPAFNRLPVVIKDFILREEIKKVLLKNGIDISYMYLRPIHHVFDLGYKKEDFPRATYFAEHLLTLPTHPLLTDKDLDNIIGTIRGVCSGN